MTTSAPARPLYSPRLTFLDGTVIGRCMRRHRHQEFIRFLNAVSAPSRPEKSSTTSSTPTPLTNSPNPPMARTSSAMDVPFHTDIGFLAQCGRVLLCNPHKATFASPKP